jgi:type II secretory pathway predicted ATPase ExeA
VADGRDRLDLTHELRLEEAPSSLFLARVIERGLPTVRAQDWTTSASSLDDLGEAVARVSASDGEQILLERNSTLVFVSLYRRHIYAAAADETRERVDAALAWLRERLPAPDPSATHEVTVNFWTYSRHGPQPSWRSISVPAWEEIEENYAAATRDSLASIMTDFEPSRAGQLILWHGKAGTGKTYALRALAWEWREWCEFHYIVDPDAFFGEHADYLMSVLLQPTQIELPMHEALAVSDPEMRYELHDENGREQKAWKLLMLEDTGELLTSDARALIGQGLSRFLNVVDGLIGQGLRVLALVTTNEEVRKLHPAVARPGRCAANIEFTPLTADEAAAWLARRGADERPATTTTLASLYATLQGLDEQALPVTGFAV